MPENENIKPCVLIVDDSQSIQLYVRDLLEEAGFRTLSATDGKMGLKYIKDHAPDVVLLDIEMPVMTGLEVLDSLGGAKRLYSIILFTHLSDLHYRIKGLDKGADDYITKPIEPDELVARVRAAARAASMKQELADARNAIEGKLKIFHSSQKEVIENNKINSLAKLASGMAHSINSPLGYINSNLGTLKKYIDVLSENMRDLSDQSGLANTDNLNTDEIARASHKLSKRPKIDYILNDIKPIISEIKEGIDHISSIIRYLQVMDNAGFHTERTLEKFNVIINLITANFRSKIPPRISFAVDLYEASLMATCNIEQIITAVECIITNAVDAISGEGTINIRTYPKNEWVCVEIRDSGEGIATEDIKYIFEPFFTTKHLMKKVGLGLTIAQCLLLANRGSIDITSIPGQGTTIVIKLPLSEVTAENTPEQTNSFMDTAGT
jgi:signal transduction histidine kinase